MGAHFEGPQHSQEVEEPWPFLDRSSVLWDQFSLLNWTPRYLSVSAISAVEPWMLNVWSGVSVEVDYYLLCQIKYHNIICSVIYSMIKSCMIEKWGKKGQGFSKVWNGLNGTYLNPIENLKQGFQNIQVLYTLYWSVTQKLNKLQLVGIMYHNVKKSRIKIVRYLWIAYRINIFPFHFSPSKCRVVP